MLSTITGDEAKRAREALGASQTAVAAAIGVNRTYYSLFEAGRYVLDGQEQQQLRSFLADALPVTESIETPVSAAPNGTPASQSVPVVVSHPSPITARAPDTRSFAAAVAALTTLRSAAVDAGPRSKRAAAAVDAAVIALQPLDYVDFLTIARERGISAGSLPGIDAFNSLGLDDMTAWESRAAALLVCDAIYGARWHSAGDSELRTVASHARRALGDNAVNYSGQSFLGWLTDSDEHVPLMRAELAPCVVIAAQKRLAPPLA